MTFSARRRSRPLDCRFLSTEGKIVGRVTPAFWCRWKVAIMQPALAFDGTDYVLAWQPWSGGNTHRVNPARTNGQLPIRRISADGKPLGASNVRVAGGTAGQLNTLPRLASDGKGHVLMVWEQHPTSSDGNVVAMTRLINTQ